MFCFLVHSNTTGATSFLFTEYQYVGIFMVVFAILIFLFLGYVEGLNTKTQQCTYDVHRMCKPALATALFSTVSFLLGAITSVLSGFLGIKTTTYANTRTTLEARKSVGKAFITAFRSDAVMGSLLFGSVHWLSESGFKESMGGFKNSSIEISGKV
ncbi:putative inorganic diphosphatase [Helianthus annuus]|nr:putative inorganic diphosphatase [Helianthus annuus]KAJ0442291.1 putative inorganic diphosphatase [Helianthus annuus]